MSWTPRDEILGIEPTGSARAYYWDININPNANFGNCLPNCTTLAYGRPLENGNPAPVSRIRDAGNWHTVTANGWTAHSYSSYRSQLKPGDIIEWPGHVAVVERIVNGEAWCSSSLYTGIHGRAEWPPGSGNYDVRDPSVIGGSTPADVWDWMLNNGYQWRCYEYVKESVITNTRLGVNPTYILENPDTPGPGPTPGPITPEITITPVYYNRTMRSDEDFVDMYFNIVMSGIPDGESASGGNSYPGLSRVYNTGWSYESYTGSDGNTYQKASKQQTLRYEREKLEPYTVTKHMYFDKTFSNGSISSDTVMTITVEISNDLIAVIFKTDKDDEFMIKLI